MKSIQMKISVSAGICLLVTAAAIIGYAAWQMHGEAVKTRELNIENARQRAADVGASIANKAAVRFDAAMNAARTLAQILSGVKDSENQVALDRDEVNAMLRIVLDRNPGFLGTYTCWEPNAFDGLDEVYAGAPGHDETGRLIPYWNRGGAGEIALEPLMDYEKEGIGDYYLVPKKTRRECVLDPYVYPVQGKDTLLTSMVVPILLNDTFYGIAGVDLTLGFLQQVVDQAGEMYDGSATVAVISHGGVLGAVTGRPELIGKHMKALHEDWEEDFTYIRKGETLVELDEGRIAAWVPLRIGGSDTPWSVNLMIPIGKVTATADAQMASAYRSMGWMAGIGACLVVVMLVILGFVARGISRPIQTTIHALDASSEQVGAAAEEVSSASQSLAEGASQQAASIQETTASLEEMSSMTRQNADNAATARGMMNQAAGIVQDVDRKMGEMGSAIDEITRSSRETGNIIKTIDEIAFQTNLLALNAAVEAARAGEAGAGFAVVADEVRSLAMRAAQAAKETAVLIENTIKAVENGEELTRSTQNSFRETVELSEKVNGLIDEIAAASSEQAQGIDQITRAVAEMDKVVQQVAGNSEESASSSEQLTAQARELAHMVEELVRIVGGVRGGVARSSRGRKPKRQGAGALPSPGEGGRRKALPRSTTAETLIPLDSDDMADF